MAKRSVLRALIFAFVGLAALTPEGVAADEGGPLARADGGRLGGQDWSDVFTIDLKQCDLLCVKMDAVCGNLDPKLLVYYTDKSGKNHIVARSDPPGRGAAIIGLVSPRTGEFKVSARTHDEKNIKTSGSYFLAHSRSTSIAGVRPGGANKCDADPSACYGKFVFLDTPACGENRTSATSAAPQDRDRDGFPDVLEQTLAQAFRPVLIFDEDEGRCVNPVTQTATLYQVTPLNVRRGQEHWDGALITYVVLYKQDCGDKAIGVGPFYDHPGDTEAIRIYVTTKNLKAALANPADHRYWFMAGALMKRHYDDWEWTAEDRFDFTAEGASGEVSQDAGFQVTGGRSANPPAGFGATHPKVFVSEKKHAMYTSKSQCENYGPGFEDCAEGIRMRLFATNMGERNRPGEPARQAFDALKDGGIVLRLLFGRPGVDEYAWREVTPSGSKEQFCGGIVTNRECAGSIGSKWWPPSDAGQRQKQLNRLGDGLHRCRALGRGQC